MVKKYYLTKGDALHITQDKDNAIFGPGVEVEMDERNALQFVRLMQVVATNGICVCDDSIKNEDKCQTEL